MSNPSTYAININILKILQEESHEDLRAFLSLFLHVYYKVLRHSSIFSKAFPSYLIKCSALYVLKEQKETEAKTKISLEPQQFLTSQTLSFSLGTF